MGLDEIFHSLILSGKVFVFDLILFMSLGLFISYILAFKSFKFKLILDLFVTLPLIFPPMATGFILLYILGKNSPVGGFLSEFNISFIFDIKGLILAGFIAAIPLFVKPMQVAFENIPNSLIEVSKSFGKSDFEIFAFVILPLCRKNLISALIIAGARSIGEVGISLLLGGNIIGKTDTISLAIYNAVFDGDTKTALVLSGILVFLSVVFYTFVYFLNKK